MNKMLRFYRQVIGEWIFSSNDISYSYSPFTSSHNLGGTATAMRNAG